MVWELWMLSPRVGSIAGPMVEGYCLFVAMEGCIWNWAIGFLLYPQGGRELSMIRSQGFPKWPWYWTCVPERNEGIVLISCWGPGSITAYTLPGVQGMPLMLTHTELLPGVWSPFCSGVLVFGIWKYWVSNEGGDSARLALRFIRAVWHWSGPLCHWLLWFPCWRVTGWAVE